MGEQWYIVGGGATSGGGSTQDYMTLKYDFTVPPFTPGSTRAPLPTTTLAPLTDFLSLQYDSVVSGFTPGQTIELPTGSTVPFPDDPDGP